MRTTGKKLSALALAVFALYSASIVIKEAVEGHISTGSQLGGLRGDRPPRARRGLGRCACVAAIGREAPQSQLRHYPERSGERSEDDEQRDERGHRT